MAKSKEERYEVLARAVKQFDSCVDAMSDVQEDAEDDLDFAAGNQWPDDVVKSRKDEKRPCLTINKLPSFINQVANDQRQNRPQGKVRPVDDVTDPKTAKVINGLLRRIQYQSDAEAAFDTATDHAITCGLGFIRVCTDYTDDDSFDQDIYIDRIDNPLNVYFPIHLCKKSDWSDAPYAFVTSQISKEEYERKYPDDPIDNWSSDVRSNTRWVKEDSVTVAEWFEIVEKEKTIHLLADGSIVDSLPDGAEAVKSRTATERKVVRRLITGGAILEEDKEFPAQYIPIVPVLGKETLVDGEKRYVSLIRNAKDIQRMINFWASAKAEKIALAPKSPYIAAEGQLEGYEAMWKAANSKSYSVLPYKPTTVAGQAVPPPQRQAPIQVESALIEAERQEVDNLKSVIGIYDASLGSRGNETSGRAIIARQREGDTANFHFVDNLSRAVRQVYRIILDMIPRVIDTERAVRILGEDMVDDVVTVNQEYFDEATGETKKLYDLTAGKYDVVVDVGPSYSTKRTEAAEALLQFVQAVPSTGQAAADLIAKNFDWPGADVLANRLIKLVPPQLLSPEEQQKLAQVQGQQQPQQPQGVPEEVVAQIVGDLQALQQQNQQLMMALAQSQKQLQDKSADRELKMDTELLKADTELAKTSMQIKPDMVNQLLETMQYIRTRVDNLESANRPESVPNAETQSLE